MDVGRLAWRTPTGAMLWEIWGRHKWIFPCHGVALAASACLVYWQEHGASESSVGFVYLISSGCFSGSFIPLMACFGYIEFDAGRVQLGFPGRLLLKPVSTTRLVLVPMLFGGAIIVTVFAIWSELVLRYLIAIPASNLLWISAMLLSFFWWMQALAWSLPSLKGRVCIDLMMAATHFFVGAMPMMPVTALSRWRWPMLIALLGAVVPAAWVGLTLVRQGRWEGPSPIARFWSHRRSARAQSSRKKFHSAFGAQFWLEWRRQGWRLPGISGGLALLIVPITLIASTKLGGVKPPPPEVILSILVLLPLLFSGVIGPALGKFDPLDSTRELPVYIAVRTMTDGGFVMAKLVMALAASILTWLLTLAGACLCLVIMGRGYLFSKAGSVTPYGPVELTIGCAPLLLLLVILTWKNMVAGIGAVLTGRQWIVTVFLCKTAFFYTGLLLMGEFASIDQDLRGALLHWLPGLLILLLAAKIVFSICAFAWGLRRNAIPVWAVGWTIGGWTVCGLFVAGYAGRVCHAINKPSLWIWVALAGFLLLPLAEPAIAPLALAWNRHR
jgi:hypothetical protein